MRVNSKSAWSSRKSNVNSTNTVNRKTWKSKSQFFNNNHEEITEDSKSKTESSMTTQRKDHNQANICQYKSKQWKGPSDKSIKLNHDFNLKESNKFIEELKISNKRLTNATIRKMDKIE